MNPFPNADHPLRAPLFAALAAEVEEMPIQEFLADTGRRARVYADLHRTLRPDVLVVDSGSRWDAAAMGYRIGWENGFPPSVGWAGPLPIPLPKPVAPPPLLTDLLTRVRAVVPEPTLLGVTVTGPATLTLWPGTSLAEAAKLTLAAARGAAEAGAGVIFVDELVPEPDGYARALTPVWGALKFLRATAVLRAPWAASLPKGPFLPCVNDATATTAPHALAVKPGKAPPAWHRAALITHTTDLAGHVAVRDLQTAVAELG